MTIRQIALSVARGTRNDETHSYIRHVASAALALSEARYADSHVESVQANEAGRKAVAAGWYVTWLSR